MKQWILLFSILLLAGCGAVKERQAVEIPAAYEEAQTASLDQLIEFINTRYAGFDNLIVSRFEVELTGGSVDDGYLERYRKANGYLVAERPEAIFVNILNPLTNSSVLTMASTENRFQVWIPSRNQYVTGDADVATEEENPIYNVRPSHILEGIMVEAIPTASPELRYFLEEDQDTRFRYYVISIVQVSADSPVLELVRRLWIERSRMRLVRQQYYRDGKIVSAVHYSQDLEVDGALMSSQVTIERPLDRYQIRFQFDPERVQINQEIKEGAFFIPQPPGAELIEVDSSDETE
ncbi:MAG TPA: hypothetical protein VKZ59_07340 [Acidobacteriota bacterium]|nr:hypothetical protein [Acidobacteriota bacterium]